MSVINDPAQGNPGQGGNPTPGGNPNPGNQPTDWRTSLPEDLRSEKVFESIKGKDWTEAGPVLAKNYVNAQRMVGADKLVVPGPNASAEEQASFYNKIGRPETADKYTYRLPEGVKAEQLNKTVMDSWLKEMHEAGVPAKAAERLLSKYLADEFATHNAAKTNTTKTQQGWELSLKEKWGAKYDESLNYAKFALKEYGDPAGNLSKFLDATGLGSHPEVLDFFQRVGRTLSDDKARTGRSAGFSATPRNPAEAQDQLNAFNTNKDKQKALFDRKDIGHDAAVAERKALFEAAFPASEEK